MGIFLHPILGAHLRDPSHPSTTGGRKARARAGRGHALMSSIYHHNHQHNQLLSNLPFSLGFTHWQQLQAWSREAAQVLLCQQSSPGRGKESSQLHTSICSPAQISPMALPCLGFGNSSCAPSGAGQTMKIQCSVKQTKQQTDKESKYSKSPSQARWFSC